MKEDQKRMPLYEAILEYNEKSPAFFHIPGHRYERGINEVWRAKVGDEIFKFDLSETPLTDDLHHASGPIKEAEQLAAELWGADYTHFLVNGSTCGNQAMVVTASHGGAKIAIPRNAHKSVLMGLIIGGGKPVYIMPQIEPEWGLHGGITPGQVEEMFRQNPDCKGVLVVSPTYYGITSDLEGIAKVCHAHDAILMVDEAHGAHCYFSEKLPRGAIEQGADMAVQSIHKVTGSLTQSSMIHIKSDRVTKNLLEANLTLVQSTSPSYILMTSLDCARQHMALHGAEMIDRAVELSDDARERINRIPGMSCAGKELIGRAGIHDLDTTRLIISADDIGITGFELKKMLFDEYDVEVELPDYRNVVAIVTYANEQDEIDKLVEALEDISRRFAPEGEPLPPGEKLPPQPDYVLSPRAAYFLERERVPWVETRGRIVAEMIAPYPPGIPVIYQGERMSAEVWDYIEAFRQRNGHIHGPSDPTLSTLLVIKE